MSSLLALELQALLQQQTGLILIVAPNTQITEELHTTLHFLNPHKPIYTFPSWETLPYDHFSPHEDIISARLKLLARLPHLTDGALIVAAPTLAYPLCPREHIQKNSFVLACKDNLHIDTLREQLTLSGYYAVSEVFSHGEFSIRGSLIDIFPMGNPHPYRIDLFDNEVESIRIFDPTTQRSHEKIDRIELLPAREFSLDKDSITHFRESFRDKFSGDPSQCDVYQTISKGSVPAGIEYYLPLFFDNINHLTDYLPKNTQFVTIGNIQLDLVEFSSQVTKRYDQYAHDIQRPLLKPEDLFLKTEQVFEKLRAFEKLLAPKIAFEEIPDIRINTKLANSLLPLQEFLNQQNNMDILFCVESAGRREALLGLLAPLKLNLTQYNDWDSAVFENAAQQSGSEPGLLRYARNGMGILIAPLLKGICLPLRKLIIITETEIFGQPVVAQRQQKKRYIDSDMLVKSLAELEVGALVVHLDHGIGRYLGLQTISVGEYDAEFLTLEYQDGDKLYVPVYSLHLISRYGGDDESASHLNKLGTQNWQRAKQKAAEKIKDVAAELLAIYAKRQARQGFAYPAPDSQYQAFTANFLFEETPDQTKAINAVLQDMMAARPMDRLICGDVGFGKTEVALRAAFVAVQSHRQVAVLVPTTLLSQQHYDTFCDRFADWPVRIALLSRFRSIVEREKSLEALAEGKIDIGIGPQA